MIPSMEAVKAINQERKDALVIPTMTPMRLWSAISRRPELDLPLVGCMGKASSIGLGLALARPDRRVMVLDGDGCLLMNLGTLVTIANKEPANLVHVVFEDGGYFTTGGQPIPGVEKLSLAGMAREAGFEQSYEFDNLEDFVIQFQEILAKPGPTFVCLRVQNPDELPPFPGGGTGEAMRRVAETLRSG